MPKFARTLWVPANEGGTHGSMSACVVTDGRLRTPMNAGFGENLTVGPVRRAVVEPARAIPRWVRGRIDAPDATCTKFRIAPRRRAPGVPPREHGEGLIILECEPTNETAADPKRVQVAVLASNGGRHTIEVPAGSFHAAVVP